MRKSTRTVSGLPYSKAVSRSFAAHSFRRTGMGGNTFAYLKHDPTVGSVAVVRDEGDDVPLRMSEAVRVFFFGLQHSEPILEQRFSSASSFLKTLKDAA